MTKKMKAPENKRSGFRRKVAENGKLNMPKFLGYRFYVLGRRVGKKKERDTKKIVRS